MNILSVRLDKKELKHIRALAKREKTDQSQAARELINEGWKFYLLHQYKEGRMSLGVLAKDLEMSLSETIDFLADSGISSSVEYDDYLQGLDVLR